MLLYLSTEYYDYEKNKIPASQVANVDSVYAVVDGIGFVVAPKTHGGFINIDPHVVVFWATLHLTGLLLLFSPSEFPLQSMNTVRLNLINSCLDFW